MSDPYVVLGVDPSASDEAVKKAYRDLVKKYHPDSYQDNPLSELAEEKMKQVNEAYDAIVKQRSGTAPGSSGHRSSYGGRQQSSDFPRVRQLIHARNLEEAGRLLEQSSNQNAEWHFLTGMVYYYRGWLNEANNYFHRAVQMEPGNSEYRQAASNLSYQANRGFQSYQQGGAVTPDCCTTLFCTACLCNSCG